MNRSTLFLSFLPFFFLELFAIVLSHILYKILSDDGRISSPFPIPFSYDCITMKRHLYGEEKRHPVDMFFFQVRICHNLQQSFTVREKKLLFLLNYA